MLHPSDTWAGAAARAHATSPRVIAWAAALIGISLVCASIPLLNILDFPFAFALALAAGLSGADLGAALVRRARALEPTAVHATVAPAPLVTGLCTRGIAIHAALLAPPLLVICLNGLRVQTCGWGFGAWAFAWMPVVSSALGTGVGVVLGIACGPRRALSNAAPFLVFFASLGYAVWRFYAAPPVFAYNLFGGYFPGNLYDESIALRAPFFWSRLMQALVVTALVCATCALVDVPRLALARRRTPRGHRPIAWVAAAVAGVAALALWTRSGELGFDVDAGDIHRALGARYDTEHFSIYYPPGGAIERDIRFIAEDHEFRYAQVARTLGVEARGRIASYYFADGDDKHRWMGARNVYMAKPWRREIYLNHQAFPHPVLRHEITHVVAGAFGDPVFETSAGTVWGLPVFFNVGMIEGIAVATDWPDHYTRALTPHQSVKALIELDMMPPLRKVLSTGFLQFSSARSYTTAGSFLRYLLDTYGAQRLREAYSRGGDLRAVYGETEAQLAAEWLAFIEATPIPDGAAEIVRERFRRPGIFKRVCPLAIARARRRVDEELARGDVDTALDIQADVCGRAPQEPRYKLELAQLLIIASRSADAAAIYEAIAADAEHMSSTVRSQALSSLAGIAARAGNWPRVVELLATAAALPLSDDDRRVIDGSLWAARHRGPAGPALRAYFWGDDPRIGRDPLVALGRAAEVALREPELGLGHYLVGWNLLRRGAPADAARAFARALERPLPTPGFRRMAARSLAESAYLAGDYGLVERAIAVMVEPDQPEVTRLYGLDFRERLRWKRTGRLLPAEPSIAAPSAAAAQ